LIACAFYYSSGGWDPGDPSVNQTIAIGGKVLPYDNILSIGNRLNHVS
jgi:hypothetical protein